MKLTAPIRTSLVCLGISLFLVAGCGDSEKTGGKPTKKDYETAIADLKEPVGIISAYAPYLDPPKSKGKYDPRPTARDIPKAAELAANEIRHASNVARQKGKSPVTKLLWDPLIKLSRTCANAKDPEAQAVCKTSISEFDAALQKKGDEASAAGAAGKFPRVGPDAITDRSKEHIAMYLKAFGPTPTEKKLLAVLGDPKVNENELIMMCDSAAMEAERVYESFEGIDEDIRKFAVVHKFSIDSICMRLKRIDGDLKSIGRCKELEEEEEEKTKKKIKKEDRGQECILACARAKTRIGEGIPAAIFEGLPDAYEDYCVGDEDEEEGKDKDKGDDKEDDKEKGDDKGKGEDKK